MMETSSAYNRGLIMEYRRIIRGKSEYIKRLQSDNNELHKDVFNMGLAEEQHQEVLVVIKVLLTL